MDVKDEYFQCHVNIKKEELLADAEKYSFYLKQIQLFFLQFFIGINTEPERYGCVFNKKGWAIVHFGEDYAEIKYIFVYPQYRRSGFFTGLLSLLKNNHCVKRITVCTKKKIMLKALVNKGFILKGKSLCKTELKYVLTL